MFVALGRRPRTPPSLVDLLLECHTRIRTFAGLAVALAERTSVPPAELEDACARIERYFVQALPLHVRDEEDSILPRIYPLSPTIDAALAQMKEQHDLHGVLVDRLCRAVTNLRRSPDDVGARFALAAIAEPFATVMEAHLRLEEDVIFPAVRRLSTAEQDDVIWEIRNRRRSAGFTSS